ncbi:hypothetical protein PAPHI01_2188 [Pancytospora philotis]|nr:hypothetical protein PAPHI01_2188 [Pancytospora philotis]
MRIPAIVLILHLLLILFLRETDGLQHSRNRARRFIGANESGLHLQIRLQKDNNAKLQALAERRIKQLLRFRFGSGQPIFAEDSTRTDVGMLRDVCLEEDELDTSPGASQAGDASSSRADRDSASAHSDADVATQSMADDSATGSTEPGSSSKASRASVIHIIGRALDLGSGQANAEPADDRDCDGSCELRSTFQRTGDAGAPSFFETRYGAMMRNTKWKFMYTALFCETPFFRHYFSSEAFEKFLDEEVPNLPDSDPYISFDNYEYIKSYVKQDLPYDKLTDGQKKLFTQVVIIKNAFDSYNLMRKVQVIYDFKLDEPEMSMESFFSALFDYFRKINRMGDAAEHAAPVVDMLLGMDWFHMALVSCDGLYTHVDINLNNIKTLVSLARYASKSNIRVLKALNIFYRAWERSPQGTLDLDVLKEEEGRVNTYYADHNKN